MPALLDATDAFVLASAWEGVPFVVAEAMAMEKPVVATNVGVIASSPAPAPSSSSQKTPAPSPRPCSRPCNSHQQTVKPSPAPPAPASRPTSALTLAFPSGKPYYRTVLRLAPRREPSIIAQGKRSAALGDDAETLNPPSRRAEIEKPPPHAKLLRALQRTHPLSAYSDTLIAD